MTSIKIDFAEEVSVDTILTPVLTKSRSASADCCMTGKSRKKEICSGTGDDFSGSELYPAALFCAKDLSPLIFGRTYAFRMMLGDCVLAYQIYESQGMLGLVYQKRCLVPILFSNTETEKFVISFPRDAEHHGVFYVRK